MNIPTTLTLLLLAALLAGCGQAPSTEATTSTVTPSSPTLPPGLLVETVDGSPIAIDQAKQTVEAGDSIIVTGHIGGRAEPFVGGRAMFTLVDVKLNVCTDGCSVPWDMCCETPEDIAASAATIQVVGPEGKPLPLSLKGPDLLAPGQRVTIDGTVHQRDDYSFVINAKRIARLAP